jgi:hypothetical protein
MASIFFFVLGQGLSLGEGGRHSLDGMTGRGRSILSAARSMF